jgi:hypothetical protein
MDFRSLIKRISLISIFAITLAFSLIFLAKLEKSSYDNNIKSSYDDEWNYISSIVQSSYIDASHNAQDSLIKIETVVQGPGYKNQSVKLYIDLKNFREHNPINDALENSIINVYTYKVVSYSNDGFIANNWGILHDFSADCAKLGATRDWYTEIQGHYNQNLAKKNINEMLHRTTINPYSLNTWYGWQFLVSKYNIYFTSLDPAYLKSMFLKYQGNIDIFESLEFSYWLPVFVDKDLAGFPIIDRGITTQNNASFWIYYGFNIVQVINATPDYKSVISTFSVSRTESELIHDFFQFFVILSGIGIFCMFLFIFQLISSAGESKEDTE